MQHVTKATSCLMLLHAVAASVGASLVSVGQLWNIIATESEGRE